MLSLRETIDKYDLMAKKALGQNFLLDSNITEKIVRLSLEKQSRTDFSGQDIFEVGPGPGGLTRAVLEKNPKTMSVIEMDNRCINIMNDLKTYYPQLDIIEGDALKFDWQNKSGHIISNLPYNISVPLLIYWLKNMQNFSSLTLMFQKEVADRILSPTGCKDYGRISVLSQLICNVHHLFDLNPQNFTPAPKVWSSVLLFTPKSKLLSLEEISKIEKITSLAFGQRRKMIRQSLKTLPDLELKLEKLSIPNTIRAENITPEQFLLLTN